jgi:hypothetical protein
VAHLRRYLMKPTEDGRLSAKDVADLHAALLTPMLTDEPQRSDMSGDETGRRTPDHPTK